MHLRQKKLYSFWENKSKDTDFINDLKKYPKLGNLIKYDKNFNSKRKVIFESSLAGIIRVKPGILYPTIVKVTNSILPDFKNAIDKIKKAIEEQQDIPWLCYHFFNCFYQNQDIFLQYTGSYQQMINPTERSD